MNRSTPSRATTSRMRSRPRWRRIGLLATRGALARTTQTELLSLEPDADMISRAPHHAAFALRCRSRETKREEVRQGGVVVQAEPCSRIRKIRHAAREGLARPREDLRLLLAAGLPRRLSFVFLHPNHPCPAPLQRYAPRCLRDPFRDASNHRTIVSIGSSVSIAPECQNAPDTDSRNTLKSYSY